METTDTTYERKYPVELLDYFGNDLMDVFGTPEEQQSKIDLRSIANSPSKIDELIKQLPNGGVLDVYEKFGKDSRPTFLEVSIEILKMFKDSGIFKMYKLPKLSCSLNRIGGCEAEWNTLYLRYPVQRSVNVWHIVRDILIEWDSDLNDPAYVRVLADGSMNVNDKQHGNFGRLIMGFEKVLVEGVYSDDPSMDSNMYASRNIQNLASSWENNANVRVTRAQDYQKEGKIPTAGDLVYLDFYNTLDDLDCSWQEASLPKKSKVCQNGHKLFRHYDQYKANDIFKSCVGMNTAIWPHGELAHEFVWGACEFMKQMQVSSFTDSQLRDIKSYIKRAVSETYPDRINRPNRSTGPGTIWGDVKSFLRQLNKESTGTKKDFRLSMPPNYLIAAGLRDLIVNWNAYHKNHSNLSYVKLNIPEIKFNGQVVTVSVGYRPDGYDKSITGYIRDDVIPFDHTELDFEDMLDVELENESESI